MTLILAISIILLNEFINVKIGQYPVWWASAATVLESVEDFVISAQSIVKTFLDDSEEML